MGRPKKLVNIDYKLVEDLASIMCTHEEIASVIGIKRPTLYNDPEYLETFARGQEQAKASLRRAQFKKALGGNATMLIWLGKQYLNQTDKAEFDANVEIEDITKVVDMLNETN